MGTPRIDPAEVQFDAIRAQGAGGQNVNKVSNAVHLRFNIGASSLPEAVKARLMRLRDSRITTDGVVVIKSQEYRSLDKNRGEALARLQEMVDAAAHVPRPRRPTQPTAGARRKRVESKVKRGQVKALRGRIVE